MSDRAPDLSSWEETGQESDDEQLFFLDGPSIETESDSNDAWAIVPSEHTTPTTDLTLSAARMFEGKSCSHHRERNCSLDASVPCCECSDKRGKSDNDLYPMYIDGHGWVEGATSWTFYCPGCKDHQETIILNQVMERLKRIVSEREAERQQLAKSKCSHWVSRGCSMTSNDKCCACSDLRPAASSGLYPAYVDGKGWAAGVSRWAYYW